MSSSHNKKRTETVLPSLELGIPTSLTHILGKDKQTKWNVKGVGNTVKRIGWHPASSQLPSSITALSLYPHARFARFRLYMSYKSKKYQRKMFYLQCRIRYTRFSGVHKRKPTKNQRKPRTKYRTQPSKPDTHN